MPLLAVRHTLYWQYEPVYHFFVSQACQISIRPPIKRPAGIAYRTLKKEEHGDG